MNKKLKSLSFLVILGLVLSFLAVPAGTALADWDPGDCHNMGGNGPQEPDLTAGISVNVMDYATRVADDFRCLQSVPILDIHIWGMYLDGQTCSSIQFELSIWEDSSGEPGTQVWSGTFGPGEYEERIYATSIPAAFLGQQSGLCYLNPNSGNPLWQYNFQIPEAEAFIPTAGTTYWLGVMATATGGVCNFGWHTTTNPWNYDAVCHFPDLAWFPLEYCDQTLIEKDMAFVITSGCEYGDAPEDALAYPSTGIYGQFPTCLGGPAGSFIRHAPSSLAFFGSHIGLPPDLDYESDGNAGSCTFPPYDQDECCNDADNDAGLMTPDSYTIIGPAGSESVVPCSNCPSGQALGMACQMAHWGIDVDIYIQNFYEEDVYVNVLMDWNQDGQWGGASTCPDGSATEHVLQNFAVGNGYLPLSGFGPPPDFRIGPNPGYVWARFTVTERPVPIPWDGSGDFDLGETEDYLLKVLPWGDYGDAPEDAIAYPSTATLGQFPTCMNVGTAGYIFHVPSGLAHFGPTIDYESDGNEGTCSFPPYDQDECCLYSLTPSAGLLFPGPYTINMSGTVVPCPGCQGAPLGQVCQMAQWGTNVDIWVGDSGPEAFVNVLMDWDQNGQWGGASTCPGGAVAPEHVLVNVQLPPGFASGNLSVVIPPGQQVFPIGPNDGYVWTRFTISESPVPAGWDGSGLFRMGETEDYLLKVIPPPAPSPPSPPPHTGGPVGITVMPMDRAGLLLPWLGLAGLMVLATGAGLFARRHLKR
jgi:hypothetical protein